MEFELPFETDDPRPHFMENGPLGLTSFNIPKALLVDWK